jgi:hypothetical protein
MERLEDDPVLGRWFDTPEKKAKWLVRIKLGYLLWLLMASAAILYLLLSYFL